MQSVLKIMPDPIAEVPRDSGKRVSEGYQGDNREKFDSVYEQQLQQEQNARQNAQNDARDNARDNDSRRDGGNDPRQKRQADDRQNVAAEKHNADTRVDSSVQDKDDRQVDDKVARAAQAKSEVDSHHANKTDSDKAKSVLEQLVGVMKDSESLLRQTRRANDTEGQANSAALKHNKLSTAIDSVLADRDKKLPDGKTEDGDVIAQMIKQNLKAKEGQLETTGRGNSSKLDAIMTPGTIADPQSDEGLAATGKGKLGGQTPGINPQTTINGTGSGNANKLDAIQTPGTIPELETDGALNSKINIAANGKAGILPDNDDIPKDQKVDPKKAVGLSETPGINPKQNMPGQVGFGEETPVAKNVFQTPGTIATPATDGDESASASVASQKSTGGSPTSDQTLAQTAQGKNVFQTPDILPQQTDEPAVTRPFEAAAGLAFANASDKNKPGANKNAFDGITGKGLASASSDAESTPGSKGADNILGALNASDNATAGGKTAAANMASQQAQAQKLNPDGQLNEKQLNDKNVLEALAAENKLKQEVGLEMGPNEERPAKFMPKDMASTLLNKGPGSISTPSAAISASSSPDTTTSSKMTPQELNRLQQTMTPNQPDFSQNMKERLTMMMNKGVQTADIRLDPAELGQMQVKMSVENDVTSVSITVQNAAAKETLEQAMPKLREMLAEQGLEMAEGSVQQEDKQQQDLGDRQNNDGQGQHAAHFDDEEQIEQITAQQLKIVNGALGGIDFFA